MTKQELIDELKNIPSEIDGTDFNDGYDFGILRAIALVAQLDDNKDFLITTYVILEENIKQALEQAKKEAYHLIDIGECVPFTVSVLNDDDHLVYKTMTKKTERYY